MMMNSTQIRTAKYMKLAEEMDNCWNKNRYVNVTKLEMYNRGLEWYAIIYYDDGDENVMELDSEFVPGGWMDSSQAIGKLMHHLTH